MFLKNIDQKVKFKQESILLYMKNLIYKEMHFVKKINCEYSIKYGGEIFYTHIAKNAYRNIKTAVELMQT